MKEINPIEKYPNLNLLEYNEEKDSEDLNLKFPYEIKLTHKEESEKLLNKIFENNLVKTHYRKLTQHDPDSAVHCSRVALLAIDLGLQNPGNFSEEFVEILGRAALLHDLGKCDIACEILGKDTELSADEFQKIKEHPRAGAEALEEEFYLEKMMILFHHEFKRNELLRYPRKDKERRLNERDSLEGDDRRDSSDLVLRHIAQLLVVADILDALKTRPYIKNKNINNTDNDEIIKILKEDLLVDDIFIGQIMKMV